MDIKFHWEIALDIEKKCFAFFSKSWQPCQDYEEPWSLNVNAIPFLHPRHALFPNFINLGAITSEKMENICFNRVARFFERQFDLSRTVFTKVFF